MKKINLYIDDIDYKNGLDNFFNYHPEMKSNISLINSIKKLENISKQILITDSDNISEKIKENNFVYKLSENPVRSKNEIYKYSSIKDIFSLFIQNDVNNSAKYEVYTIVSASEKSGKSLILDNIAEIIAKNEKCAILKLLENDENKYSKSLSELILMSIKNLETEEELHYISENIYKISGFKLIKDYVELDIHNLKILFEHLKNKLGIKIFIIELPNYLDNTAKNILEISDISFILNDKRQKTLDEKVKYLKSISKKSSKIQVLNNFSKLPREKNDLPIIRTIRTENGNRFVEKDYILFKHKISQCLEF